MAELTTAEKKWVNDVQKVLNRCPSKRLGFYTIGDPQVVVYDLTKESRIDSLLDSGDASDWCDGVAQAGADFCEWLDFPAQVHSTAG